MIETKEYTTADLVRGVENEKTNPAVALAPAPANPVDGQAEPAQALFADDETQRFRTRWTDIQAEFVDEPRRSVEKADQLVAETIKRLAEIFAGERDKLEHQWSRGQDSVSTEDLRIALRRYRSFFDRLLSV